MQSLDRLSQALPPFPTARLRASFVDARQQCFLGRVVVIGRRKGIVNKMINSDFKHFTKPDVKFKIEIEDDLMARQTRGALAKLIGTALTRGCEVVVEFQFKDLTQGMSKIVVYDDASRIPRDQAKLLSGHLGAP